MKRFERSALTKAIVAYLLMHDKGTELSYSELSRHIGEAITSATPRLTSAFDILERDHNAIWVRVRPKLGIRRLSDVDIAQRLPRWWMFGARRKLNRGGDQSQIVETDKLSIDEQSRFAVDCVQRELAFESLSKSTRKRMEKVARGNSNDLPSFNILEWAITLMPRKSS
jgi:hypothetical protein